MTSPGANIRPASEVVLPPAAVLAWSLVVLMALPMPFLAGLLIGHLCGSDDIPAMRPQDTRA
jgi:hypothetical protein